MAEAPSPLHKFDIKQDDLCQRLGGGLPRGAIIVMEGVVGRTEPYVYNEHGSRVMFKLKGRDL